MRNQSALNDIRPKSTTAPMLEVLDRSGSSAGFGATSWVTFRRAQGSSLSP